MRELPTLYLDGSVLTLKTILSIQCPTHYVKADQKALNRCEGAYQAFLAELQRGRKVYGVNVGVGALKHHVFEGEARERMNQDILLAHSAGIREYLPDEIVRIALLLRLNTLLLGYSGCSVALIYAMVDLLNKNITPMIHRYGSIGCGDIVQNGQLGYALLGGGVGRMDGKIAPMHELMAQAGLNPLQLSPKDGITLISHNAFSVAELAKLTGRAIKAVDVLMAVAFTATVAMKASPLPWQAAERFGIKSVKQVGATLSKVYQEEAWEQESTVHDPLSIRFIPEIYGAIYDELIDLVASIESLSDFPDENPLIIDNEVHPSGGSYLLQVSLRTEAVRIALAHSLRNAYNLCAHLIAGRRSGLNVNLLAPDSAMTGFGPFLKVAGALATQGCADANPVSTFSLVMADGLEDESNQLPLSVTHLRELIKGLEDMSAVLAIMACQALDLSQVTRPKVVDQVYSVVRQYLPFARMDQSLSVKADQIKNQLIKQHDAISKAWMPATFPLRHIFN